MRSYLMLAKRMSSVVKATPDSRRPTRLSSFAVVTSICVGTAAVVKLRAPPEEGRTVTSPIFRYGRALMDTIWIVGDYKYLTWRRKKSDATFDDDNETKMVHERSAQRLLRLCRYNGGIFIKIGQHIGALDYLLPTAYVETLRQLHSDAPVSSIEQVRRVINEEFQSTSKKEGEHYPFEEFEETPVGSASLAQVHRAKVRTERDKEDAATQTVAVKVQHDYIRRTLDGDVSAISTLVNVALWWLPEYDFYWLVEELRKNIPKELDFNQEANNCRKAQDLLSPRVNGKHGLPYIAVPDVYPNFSGSRVLTMQFLDGCQINDVECLRKEFGGNNNNNNNSNTNEVAYNKAMSKLLDRVYMMYARMIFRHGFVHADPHPGNILIRRSHGNDPEVVLLDHGLYETLDDSVRVDYAKLWIAFAYGDHDTIYSISRTLIANDDVHEHRLLASILTARPWSKSMQTKGSGLLAAGETTASEELHIAEHASQRVGQISRTLGKLPRNLLLILKAQDHLRALEKRLLKSRSDPRRLARTTLSECIDVYHEAEMKKVTGVEKIRVRWKFLKMRLKLQTILWCFAIASYLPERWQKSLYSYVL